jgi:hypothetical protein
MIRQDEIADLLLKKQFGRVTSKQQPNIITIEMPQKYPRSSIEV